MKKNVVTMYLISFAAIICLIHIIYFACSSLVDTHNYENRMLRELPSLSETGYEAYSDELEAYYNDHLPFRNQFISLRNRLAYYLFDTSVGEQVLVGKDGWLYLQDKNQGNTLRDYTGESELSQEELEAIADNLNNINEYFKNRNIEFVIMIAPNKIRIYDEFVPSALGEASEMYASSQIEKYLKENTDIRIVYANDEVLAAKEEILDKKIDNQTEEGIIYHKADSHWNNVGAYAGTAALVKKLGINLPDINDDSILVKQVKDDKVDLADMLHMTGDFVGKDINYEITGYSNNKVTQVQDDFGRVIEYTSDSEDRRTVYVLRDSFASNMADIMGSCFGRTYLRHYDTYSYEDLESVNPDVFVFETVERNAAYKLMNFDLWVQ